MSFDMLAMANELARDEGIRGRVYDDATGEEIRPGSVVIGHPTIGVGRALDIDGLWAAEIAAMLQHDLMSYRAELGLFAWYVALDPVRQRVFVNMRHQLGRDGLLGFHELIQAVTAKDWPEAARQGLLSRWHTQAPERSARLMEMLRTGIAPLAPRAQLPSV